MENDKPPVDPGWTPGPEENSEEGQAPPVMPPQGDRAPSSGMTNYSFGWALFAFVILSVFSLQLYVYFHQKPETKTGVSSETKITLKSSLAMETLLSQSEMRGKKPATSFVPIEDALTKDGVKDAETARYLVVVDRFLDKPVNTKALEILDASSKPIDKAYLKVADKDPTAASVLPKNSKELVDRAAMALAKEDGGDKTARSNIMSMGEAMGVAVAPLLLVALLALGVVTIVGWLVYSKTGGVGPPVGWPKRVLSLESADLNATKAGVFLLMYFVIGQVLSGVLIYTFKVDLAVSALIGQVVSIAFLVGLGAWKARPGDPGLKEMIRGSMPWHKMLAAGAMGYVANFPIFMLVTLVATKIFQGLPSPNHAIAMEAQNNSNPWITFVLFLVAAVMAPYLEETTFRGWLFSGLTTRTRNVALSIFITGVTFAVIHPQGPIVYPALACIGAMGAYLTYRTGSLIPAITMHCLHNTTILFLGKSILG